VLINLRPTPFDLNWRMFGIPVRVHPSFWLVAAIFTWPYQLRGGIAIWFIGIGCMFVSLLAHELAHALTFKFYRVYSVVVCYSLGGLTIPDGRLPLRWQRNVVTLAGPFTNLLLAGLIWGSNQIEPWERLNDYAWFIAGFLVHINLFWGLLNLLPIYPMDGGQVSRELWLKARPRTGLLDSLKMSFAVAVTFAVYALICEYDLIPMAWPPVWLRPGMFAGILFAIMAAENYVEIQNNSRSGRYFYDNHSSWR
jgi:Zn-dependent protease